MPSPSTHEPTINMCGARRCNPNKQLNLAGRSGQLAKEPNGQTLHVSTGYDTVVRAIYPYSHTARENNPDIPAELIRRAKQKALERGTSLKAVVTAALERELGPALQDVPPLQTHVWPPPGNHCETVDPDVVMRAIRLIRDGDTEGSANGDKPES